MRCNELAARLLAFAFAFIRVNIASICIALVRNQLVVRIGIYHIGFVTAITPDTLKWESPHPPNPELIFLLYSVATR